MGKDGRIIYMNIFNDIKGSSTESSYNCSKEWEGWVVSDLHRGLCTGLSGKTTYSSTWLSTLI